MFGRKWKKREGGNERKENGYESLSRDREPKEEEGSEMRRERKVSSSHWEKAKKREKGVMVLRCSKVLIFVLCLYLFIYWLLLLRKEESL